MNPEVMRKARAELAARQDAHRARRAADAQRARAQVPEAAELAQLVRRARLDALGSLLRNPETMAALEATTSAMAVCRKLEANLADLLTARGFEPDILFDAPLCRLCGDAGYVGPRMCVCLKEFVDKAVRAVPHGLGAGSFSRFDLNVFSDAPDRVLGMSPRENMEGHLHFCRGWAARFAVRPGGGVENLFLNGGTGQGKTFLCGCMAETVAAAGFSVCYATAVRLFEKFEAARFGGQARDGGENDGDTSFFLTADLLIIDDLGAEMVTAFVQSVLYDVINTRLTDGLKTVITANLSSDQMAGRYLPQVCSRLMGEYKMLHFFGPDLRLVRHKSKFTV